MISMRTFDQQARSRRDGTFVLGNRGRVNRARPRRRQPGAAFDFLEDRTVLSTLDITSSALTYDAQNAASALTVSLVNSTTVSFHDADQTITLGAGTTGWSGGGTNTITGPLSSYGSMTIGGTDAGQSLTIDYTNGDPLHIEALTYDPAAVTGGAVNSLNLMSGPGGLAFQDESYAMSGPGAGNIAYDAPNGVDVIEFSNLSPVTDTVPSPTFSFFVPVNAQTVNITGGPSGTTEINDGGTGTFELVDLANKTSVTAYVENAGATTTIDLASASAGLAALAVNSEGLGGNDTIDVQATPHGVTTTTDTGSHSGSNSYTNIGDNGVLTHILGNVSALSTSTFAPTNTLTIDDSASPSPQTYTISGSTVTATSFPATISFLPAGQGGFQTLLLKTSGGATVNLNGPAQSGASAYDLTGGIGFGANTLKVSSNVSELDYSTAGTLSFGTNEPTISYTNFATINVTKPATAPVGSAATITGTQGQALSNVVVATFTEADLTNLTANIVASINWGDSTTATAGTVTPNGTGGFDVTGSHTYAQSGKYTVDVTLTDQSTSGTTTVGGTTINVTSNGPVNSSPNPIASTADIAAAPLIAQGVPVSGFKGVALNPAPGGDVLVATFMDTGTIGSPADYTASINWGDGSAATADTRITSQGTPNGVVFSVFGNHTYATTGTFTVVTTITKTASGSTAIAASTATIAAQTALPTDSVENLTGSAISAVQDVEFTKTIATFTDTSSAAVVSDFLATINWGDGTTTAGTISEDANDTFYVTGTHTYTKAGAFTPIVTIKDPSGTLYTTGNFNQTNLVSSVSGMAAVIDPNLINPWGMSSSSTSPIWVSDQGKGVSTLYNPNGNPIIQGLTVAIPATGTPSGPTGQVFNTDPNAGDFIVPTTTASALFLFADLDGTIVAWNASLPPITTAATAATVAGAAFTGLAQANVTSGSTTNYYLYAADFTGTTGASGIDVFSASFTNVSSTTFAGKFVDPNAIAGFDPYNIALLNGDLYVAYAKPSGIVTSGGGYIDEFSTAGNFISRIYTDTTGTNLAGPWGMAIAPAGFGPFGGDLLVGNFGNGTSTAPNGTIVAINLTTGGIAGILSSPNGTITNAGQWSLLFGNGGSGGTTGTLYFSAGIDGQTQGVFGAIAFAAAPSASVAAAPLDAQGATVRGIEGNSLEVSNGTADVLVGTFMDTGTPGAASSYSATINWGDGSTPTPDVAITSQGTPNGTVFSAFGNHTYANVGTYQMTVTITNTANGAVAIASSTAVIQPAALAPVDPQPLVSDTERVIFSGPVGEFIASNPMATASQFSDLIDWGDGSPESAGTVIFLDRTPVSTSFEIIGTHTYADLYSSTTATSATQTSSTFPLLTHVVGTDGSSVNLTNTATVLGGPFSVSGHLNSASDSGISDSDGITNVTQPTFNGITGEPNAKVLLYATSNGTTVLIGQGTSGANENWSITPSIALTDGSYAITATAVDGTNSTISATATIVPNLVIDTVGPKVTDVVFNRLHGQIIVTYQDFGGVNNTGVGMDLASEIDANNYQLTTVHHPRIGKFRVNVISVVPGTTAGTQTATLTINHGAYIKGGWYFFTIFSTSPTNVTGVQDIAANGLDGEFYGYFPSGNNVAGGNYVAQLTAIHHTIFAPSTIIGRATPVSPPGTRPGSIHIKQTINPGKLPPSLKGNVADASKKAKVKLVRHADKVLRPSGASAKVAVSSSSASANGSSSIGALSALDTALDQIDKPKHHGS
jgi:uncharacterized protein (TIGR03118 family)